MISQIEIKSIVQSGEGYNSEFKRSVPSKVKEISEEVCAFANAAGGTILIGVTDNNQIIGAQIDNKSRSAIQNSIGEISPGINCLLNVVEVDGKTIGMIEVPSGKNKPYVLSGAIYVRVGPNSQKLTTVEEMRDFFQQSVKIYFDNITCDAFEAEDIDNDVFEQFTNLASIDIATNKLQIFSNLRLTTDSNCFKNGAVLFFGKYPEYYFENAIVRCVAFEGFDKRFIIDDKVFGGALYRQFQQAMLWIKQKISVKYDIEGQGSAPRKEIWEVPEIVLKEAIINSLSHRDYYEKGAVTTIELFYDRIEISNPGGLVSAIRKEEFGNKSLSRNPLIFGLFARMQLVEQVGSGINRMRSLMKEANLPLPQFSTEGMFNVALYRPKRMSEEMSEKMSEKTSEKIIRLLSEDPNTTIADMAKKIGVTNRTIERNLGKLKADGRIIRLGGDKGGYWKLVDIE